MRRAALIYIVFLLIPSLAIAQMDEFQQQFMEVNQRYLSEKNIMVTQHYFFSLDSASAVPFDSGYCYIKKYDGIMHYMFNGVELFNDGTYLIRISNPDKYMIVSRSIHQDSSALGFIFKEGFSIFKNVVKKNISNELSQWSLTGGTYGVLAAEITFDTREARVKEILAELSPDHPLTIQIYPRKPGMIHTVFIKINFNYTTEFYKAQHQISDYINVEDDVVITAAKFKDYQIKFIK